MDQIYSKRVFLEKNGKSEHHHCIFGISLDAKFHFKQTVLNFWTKFAQKRYFRSNTKNVNITIEFCIFELPNFNLNWQFWFFGPKLLQKGISSLNEKKWAPPWNFSYSSYSWYQISAWTENFDILDQICPKRVFLV